MMVGSTAMQGPVNHFHYYTTPHSNNGYSETNMTAQFCSWKKKKSLL